MIVDTGMYYLALVILAVSLVMNVIIAVWSPDGKPTMSSTRACGKRLSRGLIPVIRMRSRNDQSGGNISRGLTDGRSNQQRLQRQSR